MGILGKDLFELTYEFFHFKALFSNEDIEIEKKNYKHGEILTDFLNYDPTSFLEAVEEMKRFMEQDDSEKYYAAERRTEELLMQMPLYRDFTSRREQLAFRRVFFHEYRNFEDYQKLYEDLKQLDRYRWFIREKFYEDGKVDRNKFPQLIYHNCIDAFVSGSSLGVSHMVDPADTSVQYEWRESKADGKPHIYEKMLFKRIIAFWYVDLFKAIMNQYSPKPCKLAGNSSYKNRDLPMSTAPILRRTRPRKPAATLARPTAFSRSSRTIPFGRSISVPTKNTMPER